MYCISTSVKHLLDSQTLNSFTCPLNASTNSFLLLVFLFLLCKSTQLPTVIVDGIQVPSSILKLLNRVISKMAVRFLERSYFAYKKIPTEKKKMRESERHGKILNERTENKDGRKELDLEGKLEFLYY